MHTAAELDNYIAAVKHSSGVTLRDMQGNTAKVLADKSAQDGKLTAYGIDRVLMSGAPCERARLFLAASMLCLHAVQII
jgi:hypothetical protein